MTFEKDLRSVSRAASQRLGILRKSWLIFHGRSHLVRCLIWGFCPSPFWSSVLQCFARLPITHLNSPRLPILTTDRVVSGIRFLTEGVFECDNAHRRSVAVLWMLYKIRCNPMQFFYGALPVPYLPVLVTRCALVAYGYNYAVLCTYAPPRCRTSQYRRTFIPLSVSLWNDLVDPVIDGVGLADFKRRANALLWD